MNKKQSYGVDICLEDLEQTDFIFSKDLHHIIDLTSY